MPDNNNDDIKLPKGYTLIDPPNAVDPSTIKPPPGYTLIDPSTMQMAPHNQINPTLPEDLPERMGNLGLKALPMAGAIAGSALTGGAGAAFLPAVAGATAGGFGGSLLKQGIQKLVGSKDAPQSIGEAGTNALTDAAVNGLSEGVGRGVNAALAQVFSRAFNPEQLYQSALMPAPSRGADDVRRAVNAGINERIYLRNPQAAMDKAKNVGLAINNQIDSTIAANPNAGTIDPKAAIAGLNGLRIKWAQGTGDPSYQQAINDVENNFLVRHPNAMSPADAQLTKKAIYGEIRQADQNAWQNGFGQPNPLTIQSKQAIVDGLKSDLETIYPDIKNLNAREGSLIELQKSLDRFVGREGNKRITPYFATVASGAMLGGGMGAYTGHGAMDSGIGGAIGALGAHLLRAAIEDPGIKSALAITLRRAGNTSAGRAVANSAPYIAPNLIRLTGAMATGPQSQQINQTEIPPQ